LVPVEPVIDAAKELAARVYVRDHCCDLKHNELASIRLHARALHAMGMTEGWIRDIFTRVYVSWDLEFAIIRSVEAAFAQAEMFADVADPDGEAQGRFAGKDLAYFENLPALEWLWRGILAKESLFVIYGKEKTGKTFFALSLALGIASAYPSRPSTFCGLPLLWGRVLYIIAEGNEKEFANRLHVYLKANSKPGKDREVLRALVMQNFKVVTVPVMINIEDQVKALLKQNPGDWDLVVIDTYMRSTSGNVNDPQDAAAFVRGCDTIRSEAGTAVLVVHHQGKDEKRGAFGSMHLTGACDGAAVIIKQDVERVFRMKLMRNGDDAQDDIVYTLPTELIDITDDGDERSSCAVKFVERRNHGSAARAEQVGKSDMLLWTIYHEKPKDQQALASRLGTTDRTLARRLKALREAGLLGARMILTPEGLVRAKVLDADLADAE
jgi:hypothetical protein